ncbi:MAG TPA: signal peptidase II [Galbitalea sp.]|nr:signal peptidase II [Galbitalea sp.]
MPETESAPKASTSATRDKGPRIDRRTVRVLVVLALVALGIYGFDQFSKYLIVKNLTEGQLVNVLGDVLQFHFVKNSGAAFSIGTSMTWVFSIVAAAVVVFIIIYAPRIRSFSWAVLFGMLLGGALGNLSDRLFREPRFGEGHVVDFIQVIYFPAIFNIADSSIVISMCLFVLLTIRGVRLDGKRTHNTVQTPAADARQ